MSRPDHSLWDFTGQPRDPTQQRHAWPPGDGLPELDAPPSLCRGACDPGWGVLAMGSQGPISQSRELSYLLFSLDLGVVEGDGLGALGQHVLLQLAELVLVVFSLGANSMSSSSLAWSGCALPGPMVGMRAAPGWVCKSPSAVAHMLRLCLPVSPQMPCNCPRGRTNHPKGWQQQVVSSVCPPSVTG